MRLRDAIKHTNQSYSELLEHDHWEIRESAEFYLQSIKDFCYATKNLLIFIFNIFSLIIVILLYPIAIIIRVMKK